MRKEKPGVGRACGQASLISPSAMRLMKVRQDGWPALGPVGALLPVSAARRSRAAHSSGVSLSDWRVKCCIVLEVLSGGVPVGAAQLAADHNRLAVGLGEVLAAAAGVVTLPAVCDQFLGFGFGSLGHAGAVFSPVFFVLLGADCLGHRWVPFVCFLSSYLQYNTKVATCQGVLRRVFDQFSATMTGKTPVLATDFHQLTTA